MLWPQRLLGSLGLRLLKILVRSGRESWILPFLKLPNSPEPDPRYANRAEQIPLSDRPRVDIVLLVRNQPKLTRACLHSLFENTNYPDYGVTVVDNGSRPSTAGLLSGFARQHRQMKVITNRANQSYSDANNQGAAATRGELILFLNNDTEILQPGWLTHLVDELKQRPRTAAVGPRLLLPDRQTVQSAGIRINLDNGQLQGAEEIRQPLESRPVDALTAACLLIRRDAFEALGGFDPRYRFGQEDVDLCLGLKALGFDLYHSHQVQVLHHQQATRSPGPHYELNRIKLRAKWSGRASDLEFVELAV